MDVSAISFKDDAKSFVFFFHLTTSLCIRGTECQDVNKQLSIKSLLRYFLLFREV